MKEEVLAIGYLEMCWLQRNTRNIGCSALVVLGLISKKCAVREYLYITVLK